MTSKKKENHIKIYFKKYFSNNFILRFSIWILGTIFLLTGLIFLIVVNLGLGTYDAFFQPLRILIGIKNNEGQYGYMLMVVGAVFYLVATLMNYIRTKKIRIDYLFGIIYIVAASFVIKKLLSDIPFINNMLINTSKASIVFMKYPEALGMLFVGIPFFMIGIGMTTACNIIPNNYAILVEEISLASKRSFKFVQYLFDIALIAGGLLITIINIYATNRNTWLDVFKFIGIGTLIILLLQSQVINYSLLKTRAIISKKEKLIMTPHISAQKGEIAKTVLMPGDPLRAKYIADNFLTSVKQVNWIRNMFMFTGKYEGREISICGSGMGQSSIGIYSYELFKFYNVENIIRIGSAGSYKKNLKLYDVVLAKEVYSDSELFNKLLAGINSNVIMPSIDLNNKIKEIAKMQNIKMHEVRVHSSDVFYSNQPLEKIIKETAADCVEMEAAALFANAKFLGKNAACLLTISDNLITQKETSAKERQSAFTDMMKIALELA